MNANRTKHVPSNKHTRHARTHQNESNSVPEAQWSAVCIEHDIGKQHHLEAAGPSATQLVENVGANEEAVRLRVWKTYK